MLSLEYLLEEAKSNGLPILKERGVLREYLQVIILNSIYKHPLGKSMFFTGGTALRFFYNLPRFSEDLDFDTPELNYMEFLEILGFVKKGLIKEGLSAEISSKKRKNLYVAELYFENLMELYKITNKGKVGLMIKIEVYKPSWLIQPESAVLSLYGYNFSSLLLKKEYLFSEKLCALFNRRRGRDIYDTLFLLKKKIKINPDVLTANQIKGLPKDIITEHLKNMPEKELKFLTEQVRPFLFKEEDIELILKAPLYAEKFLKEYPPGEGTA